MDRVSTSIFFSNVKLALKQAEGGISTNLMVRESFVAAPGGKEFIKKETKRMSHGWSRREVPCLILVQSMTNAGQSINSFVNKTGEWGRKQKEEFKRGCDDEKWKNMRKVES